LVSDESVGKIYRIKKILPNRNRPGEYSDSSRHLF